MIKVYGTRLATYERISLQVEFEVLWRLRAPKILMRVKNALPVCLVCRSLTPIVLALLLAASWGVSLADTQKQREAKARHEANKHEVKPHQATKHTVVKHPNEHPEARAKQHEAGAKKRQAEDKKRESKAKRDEAKEKKTHPVALRSKASDKGTHRDKSAMDGAPGTAAGTDEAMASQVHAWEESRKQQPGAVQTPATAADSGNAGTASEAGAASGAAASMGVSSPPPDSPQAEVSKPANVVSVIRRPGEQRPQLEPTEEMAAEPVILPALYTKRGRLVMPPPLKGSHEILIRQNQMADDEGLDRIRDDDDLDRMRRAGLLIPIPSGAMLRVDDRLPANRRYCRPWAAVFLTDMSRQFYARFGEALQVNSAVRTVQFQQRLIHTNGNAAPAGGDSASPHLTGQAVDIGKHGLSQAEIAWVRWYLLPLVQAEKVDVEEEFQQACFHISVYKGYLPRPATTRREVAAARHGGMSALATGLR